MENNKRTKNNVVPLVYRPTQAEIEQFSQRAFDKVQEDIDKTRKRASELKEEFYSLLERRKQHKKNEKSDP